MTDDPRWKIPELDPAFVAWIDSRFPEKCPDPSDTEREIWMKAGERRMVVWLKTQLSIQQDQPR